MKILVTGAGGMLGRDLCPVLETSHDVTGVDVADFDITDAAACEEHIGRAAPGAVVHCAAFTDVDRCEAETDTAMRVNGEAPGYVARACAKAGAWMIHLSTDYVFDGNANHPYREDDPVGPLSAYGRSKLEGERRVLDVLGKGATILRTAWLYGPHGKNFVEAILRIAAEKEFLTVVDDQRGCPTYTVDLAGAIAAAIENDARGVFHAVNAGEVTWNGFAKEILRLAGIDKEVRPLTTAELGRPAHRPASSVLSTGKLFAATGHAFRPWQDAIAAYMRRRSRASL